MMDLLLSLPVSYYRLEGIRGFYRGFLPCILRSFPTNGAALFVFDHAMRMLSQ
jgi:solute carrier family 25 carnitine/acylcarnitine transporter 20/29